MKYRIFSTLLVRKGAMAVLQETWWAIVTMAWAFIVGAALLSSSGCDHAPEGAQKAVVANDGAGVDRNIAVEFASATVTKSSAVQYASSVDPGDDSSDIRPPGAAR